MVFHNHYPLYSYCSKSLLGVQESKTRNERRGTEERAEETEKIYRNERGFVGVKKGSIKKSGGSCRI